jgi:hypothetical protein
MNIITYRTGAPLALCQRALQLSERETKFALLALDPAASEGEIQNCSISLIRSLRRRYRDGHALLRDLAQPATPPPPAVTTYNPYANTRMPFGKHRGKRLCEIDVPYLLWLLSNCRKLDPHLRAAIRTYLS